MTRPLLKICCIKSPLEARMALDAGADFLGFVSEMPDGPGVVSLSEIRIMIKTLPPGIKSILLTSKTLAGDIHNQRKSTGVWGVQIVDHIPKKELSNLRSLDPDLHIIQVVHIQSEASVAVARGYYDLVDYLLLDSGLPDSGAPSLGGTGRTHDWKISHRICAESPIPVLLAGGINSSNVAAAFQGVSPSGVDLCSGLRTDDHLDTEKLELFMNLFEALNLST